jgi:hypothetical protein
MAATKRVVDLTDVKEGGVFRPRRKPEGDYRAKIVKADDHESKDPSKPMGWVLTIQVEGDARSTYPYYLSPDKKQAWKIGAICRAAGISVKNARINFDPNKLVNKPIGLSLEDDEYEGRPKSTIGEVFPVSEVGANADEDAPEDDDDIDTGDEEELEEDEPEEEPEPPKRRRTTPPTKRVARARTEEPEDEEEPPPSPRKRTARKAAPPPPVEEDEEEEDEDEEPAPPPPRRRAAAPPAKKAASRRAAPPPDDDDDDLDEIDTDDLDD